MKRPQQVPAEAEFNSTDNQWQLVITYNQEDGSGEYKYWTATGDYFGHTIVDETSNTLTFTIFHPDGTYSQKGTTINGVLEGPVYYQKSEHATTEPVLDDPLYKHVFRAIGEFENGEVIWWKYFNKEDQLIDLDGDLILTMDQFSANFQGSPVPEELALLLEFEQQYGCELYAENFNLTASAQFGIKTWSENPEFLKRLMAFAYANGSGSFYAIWDDGSGKPLNEMPVVVFGDEGGVHVVAKDVIRLMQLLTLDLAISVDHDRAYFYNHKDEGEETDYAPAYKEWFTTTFNLEVITDGEEIINEAQDTYKASFDTWFNQYVS